MDYIKMIIFIIMYHITKLLYALTHYYGLLEGTFNNQCTIYDDYT